MFMSDVNKCDKIKNVVIEDLRGFGIKYRPKKQRHNVQDVRIGRRLFKTALHLLPTQTVTLVSGQQLVVPKLVHELCSFILTKVETEGLFRKAGSKARQNEIRLSLDAGCHLDDNYHEIDVANVLKTFFRELPEPLLPFSYHELFLRCVLLQEDKLKSLLLACLLLPTEHLNTLTYFMQFLHHVTEHSVLNKMDAYNLAVVIGPTIFPMEEKLVTNASLHLSKTCELFKLLIENARNIGYITESIIDRIASEANGKSDNETTKRKKKRRSGSLTRVFNGLKKMVSSKPAEDSPPQTVVTPNTLPTLNLSKSSKKRKMESGGLSNKKRQELLQTLPQGTALSTPVSVHPNPRNNSPLNSTCKTNYKMIREKKSHWNLTSKRSKMLKQTSDAVFSTASAFTETKSALERRWSAVSQAAGFKKNRKVRRSYSPTFTQVKDTSPPINVENSAIYNCDTVEERQEPDYMKISRSEYEEIKNRVSAIEHTLSIEMNYLESKVDDEQSSEKCNGIKEVQDAYEETLVKAEPLSPTTDQLARRLSKELKIRRSFEQKVIRSPSARKIGSVRRRSGDNDKQTKKVRRNQSWHVESANLHKINLKRGKPNTLYTDLPCPTPLKVSVSKLDSNCLKRSMPLRSASLPGSVTPSPLNNHKKSFNSSQASDSLTSEKWTCAEDFFSQMKTPNAISNCRASLAKLRSQNAGMVLAKARLFDCLIDSDNSTSLPNARSVVIPKVKGGQHKIGSTRSFDMAPYKRHNEKDSLKQSVSPKKRNQNSPIKSNNSHRMNLCEKENQIHSENFSNVDVLSMTEKSQGTVLKDCNRLDMTDVRRRTISPGYLTPKIMPHIKKSITVKSPRRLCRTPLGLDNNKHTPLRAIASKRVY